MAKKQKVRAAAVQIAPDLTSGAATLDRVIAAIDEAAGKGAELIVFPETFVPWYPYFSFVPPPVQSGAEHIRLYEHAIAAPGPETERVAAAARKHGAVVVLGVNERDHGTLYNTQLVFDADGALKLKRRKITPTFHERMIWGQGDGSGLTVVDTAVGRVGALACWEHYNPLARYALMAQHEEIHAAQFPGSLVGPIFAEQIEVTIRHHALESGCFVVNATGWLTEAQIASITPNEALQRGLRGGCMTAIISPEGRHLAPPLTEGEGMVDRRPRSCPHHQAQAHDGFRRPLRAPRTPQRPARSAPGPSFASTRPSLRFPPKEMAMSLPTEQLINELQSFGVRLADPEGRRRKPARRRRPIGPQGSDDRRRDGHGAGAYRAGLRQPLCHRETRPVGREPHPARRLGGRRSQLSRRAALLRPEDRRRRPVLAYRDAARPRRAGDHRPADLHPLSEPHEDLPVLRHRPVACGGADDRAQDAGATRRSRARGGRARRREAHGDDHRHAAAAAIAARQSCAKARRR